ncbi:MAG: arginyltransferase [Desulfuromonadaceae bacterium]
MQLLHSIQLEELSPCPYLPGRDKCYEYFLAEQLSAAEISAYLELGWRKFGIYYFRPACPGCRVCTPLRIPVGAFVPSRSQCRVLKKCAALDVRFGPLQFSARALAISRDHSRRRFGQEGDVEEFLLNFYLPSCPGLQTEIFRGAEMIGVGFLDRGENCLSSVYFCFDTACSGLNLGTFSILKEIEQAQRLGLSYYYLGYCVADCPALAYKNRFRPHQYFDWAKQIWFDVDS